MSIVSGQDSRLQIGLANTWRVATRTKVRLPYTTEGFKGTPNYKESEALVGASGLTSMAIMSYKADGAFTTYLPPDLAKILLYAALGAESAVIAPGGGLGYGHKFTPIPASACANLPSLTVEVDRLVERAIYMNYKMTTWKISGKAEDYLMFDCDGPAFKEDQQTILRKFAVATPAVATANVTVVPPVGAINAADVSANAFVGKIARIISANCGPVYYFSVALQAINLLTMLPIAAWGMIDTPANYVTLIAGGTIDILDWEMAPNLAVSPLEYFRFVHGYMYMDDSIAAYRVLGATVSANGYGKNLDSAVDVPITLTGGAGFTIEVEAIDPGTLVPRVYRYIGAAITRTATVLGFMDTPVGTDKIQSIFNASNVLHANWVVVEDAYDEITEFTLSGDNKISDGLFGMNSSMYQAEVNPTSRDFNLDVTSRFTNRLSQLRVKRMQTGYPVHIKLVFETKIGDGPLGANVNTSIDTLGRPYRMEIDMKKCYYTEGGANISGPDEPTISPKFRLAETPNVHKAVEITIYDDVSVKTSDAAWNVSKPLDGWVPMTREDGFVG